MIIIISNTLRLCLETNISFHIVHFNYEIMNEEFENGKVWKVTLKFSTITTFKTMVEATQIKIQIFFIH